MKMRSVLALSLLTTLTLSSALADGMSTMRMGTGTMRMSSMQKMPMKGSMTMPRNNMGASMMGVPMLRFTTMQGMNMMMGRTGDLMVMGAPGMGSYTYNFRGGHTGTVTYRGRNARSLFGYYDRAIRAEGWKRDTHMAMGMMGRGSYSEAYMLGRYKLDLSAVTFNNSTVVTFKTHL